MNSSTLLYQDPTHQCIMFSVDEQEHEDRFLSVNQYLIIHNGYGILVDPGSENTFHELSQAVQAYLSLDRIAYIFFSHQDPDVAGSISLWSLATPAKLVISKLWVRFMGHYNLMDSSRLIALEDKGTDIILGEDFFRFIPAHFLHSPGNFSFYDSRSRILFSGDIGAAIVELSKLYKEVQDFEAHKPYLEAFHRRYMAGNHFARAWVSKVRLLQLSLIAPQHGALFRDPHIEPFLNWFEAFQCGGDTIDTLYF